LVASLSSRCLAEGSRFCFLYTNLANPTSNRLYVELGYEPVCDSVQYAFDA
jgi:predicted GNAT family acetyltransferase